MQSSAFAAGKLSDNFLLIAALEVETAQVGAGRGGLFAHRKQIIAAGYGFEYGFVVFQ